MSTGQIDSVVVERARASAGISDAPIYRMVARTLDELRARNGTIVDVGCGTGALLDFVPSSFSRYIGADVLRYDGLRDDVEFVPTNLDSGRVALADGTADVSVAVEVIEHVENPRALMRELVRLTRPGGWIVVTTPNLLSLLSLLTLVVKGRHAAFQDVHYPAHLSALLEVDLTRMARENGLVDSMLRYSLHDRIIFTPYAIPAIVAGRFPQLFSNSVLLATRKPVEELNGG